MAKACVALDSCVDRSTAMLAAGDYDKGLASHLAWLTKQLAGVTSELRKLEAHDEKIVAKLSPEKRDTLVMAYLKGLPPSRQTSIAAELQAMADRGGLLA